MINDLFWSRPGAVIVIVFTVRVKELCDL
jgi:hypothetical protein